MSRCFAAAEMDGLDVQIWDPTGLQNRGFDVGLEPLPLVGSAKLKVTFSEAETYTKLSNRLFNGLPSWWWTCHVLSHGGSPWNMSFTTRWTRHPCPAILMILYPDGCRYPSEMAPRVLQYLPKELTCQCGLCIGWTVKCRRDEKHKFCWKQARHAGVNITYRTMETMSANRSMWNTWNINLKRVYHFIDLIDQAHSCAKHHGES